ncbi:MAG: hypothetical protein QOG10_2570 [Kribbellaceae bacterium]|nr:hypothetical protein [Kribbellaceae bacterium]
MARVSSTGQDGSGTAPGAGTGAALPSSIHGRGLAGQEVAVRGLLRALTLAYCCHLQLELKQVFAAG